MLFLPAVGGDATLLKCNHSIVVKVLRFMTIKESKDEFAPVRYNCEWDAPTN